MLLTALQNTLETLAWGFGVACFIATALLILMGLAKDRARREAQRSLAQELAELDHSVERVGAWDSLPPKWRDEAHVELEAAEIAGPVFVYRPERVVDAGGRG